MEQPETTAPGLPRRLAAIVYDTFLVLPLIMLTVAVALGIVRALGLVDADAPLPPWAVQLLAAAACLVFFGAFWLKGGQTLGMQAWRIRLETADGGTLRPWHVLKRCCGAVLSAGFFGLGYLWCIVDPRRRSWHDRISGTRLVLLPKRSKQVGN